MDGSDEPSQGLVVAAGFGGPGSGAERWAVGPRVAVGFPQGWALEGAQIGRFRLELELAVSLEARVDVVTFAARLRGGAVLELRETRAVDPGLVATEPGWTAVPVVGLDGGLGVRVTDVLSVALWLGLDAWLAPPAYAIPDGPTVEPWPIQPRAALVARVADSL